MSTILKDLTQNYNDGIDNTKRFCYALEFPYTNVIQLRAGRGPQYKFMSPAFKSFKTKGIIVDIDHITSSITDYKQTRWTDLNLNQLRQIVMALRTIKEGAYNPEFISSKSEHELRQIIHDIIGVNIIVPVTRSAFKLKPFPVFTQNSK